jgi:hypothetical protein
MKDKLLSVKVKITLENRVNSCSPTVTGVENCERRNSIRLNIHKGREASIDGDKRSN